MTKVSTFRLFLLRGMYLLISVGLGLTVWPVILQPETLAADPKSVIRALLGALAVLSLLGLRYPLKMLPVLLFELLWKVIWVVTIIPLWRTNSLGTYGQETLFACLIGVVLVPLVIPWGYVIREYLKVPADPLTARR